MPVKEAEATNALCDAGCEVTSGHVEGPKVVMQTAAGRGAFICGYHVNQAVLAPDKDLTSAEWNWGKVYSEVQTATPAGGTIPNFVRCCPMRCAWGPSAAWMCIGGSWWRWSAAG